MVVAAVVVAAMFVYAGAARHQADVCVCHGVQAAQLEGSSELGGVHLGSNKQFSCALEGEGAPSARLEVTCGCDR